MWPLILEKSKETFLYHDTRSPDPDWKGYVDLQVANRLPIITARVEDQELVGYIVWIISANMHRKSEKVAYTDTYYIKKEWRKGYAPARAMFKKSFNDLRELGVGDIFPHSNEIWMSPKMRANIDRFFISLGCKPFGVVYLKE